MANEMTFLKGLRAKSGDTVVDCGFLASAIQGLPTASTGSAEGVWVNPSNNLEINSNPGAVIPTSAGTLASDSKLNLVSANAVQIKPGKDVEKIDTINALQLDSELGGLGCKEFPIKVCNGSLAKKERVGALKLNTSELIFDTQNSSLISDDYDEFQIKFRYDKKEHPIYAKMKARAFDFRCLDHGGIALQIAGHDGDNHENKIKFESDRTSGIGETPVYCKEGGKGVEFGTFNTEHASLYVGDYRFRGESMVYGVTRDALVTTSTGKRDYPKQDDDFADVVDVNNGATWNDIIGVAKAWKADELGGVSEDFVKAEIAKAALEGGDVDMSVFVTKEEVKDVVASAMSEFDVDIDMTGFATENYVDTKIDGVKEAMAPAVDHIAYTELKDDVVKGLDIKLDEIRNQNALDAYVVAKAEYDNYVVAKEAYDALSEEEKANTVEPVAVTEPALVEPEYRSLNLVNPNGKLAIKTADVSMETPTIVIPFEISKKGKFTMGGVDVEGVLASKTATVDDLIPYIKEGVKIAIRAEKNNAPSAALATDYPEGSDLISVSVYDLLSLVDRVSTLESKLVELEAKVETYHPAVNTPEVTE